MFDEKEYVYVGSEKVYKQDDHECPNIKRSNEINMSKYIR